VVMAAAAHRAPYEGGATDMEQILEESDACGVGFIASLKGERKHKTISDALMALGCMEAGSATMPPSHLIACGRGCGKCARVHRYEVHVEEDAASAYGHTDTPMSSS